MKINFITGNKNKFEEAKKIIKNLRQLDIDLPEIQDIDPKKIIEAKLEEASKNFSGNIVTEDVSLCLDCLNGLPGPLIKWFLKTIKIEGIYDLAKKYNNFGASAVAIIGLKTDAGIQFFEGSVRGVIVEPRGVTGFGWDPIFEPEKSEKTFAEMDKEEKNKISHRSIAFNKLKEFIEK